MTETIVGVIGAGRIGRMHAHNLVHSVPEATVKTVASRSVDETWAGGLGIRECVPHAADLLQDAEIEAVVIALPSQLHADELLALPTPRTE